MRSQHTSFADVIVCCQFIVAYFCINPLLMITWWGTRKQKQKDVVVIVLHLWGNVAAFTTLVSVFSTEMKMEVRCGRHGE